MTDCRVMQHKENKSYGQLSNMVSHCYIVDTHNPRVPVKGNKTALALSFSFTF